MRHTTIAALAGAVLFGFSAVGAQAFSPAAAPQTAPLIQQAAQGCGPGFARGPRGACRRIAGWGPRCVVRRTPWGPRRVCR